MIWKSVEIIAAVLEAFIVLIFNINYFKFKNNRYAFMKILISMLILSLWDYFGTLLAETEIFSLMGFILTLFIFSLLYLKGSSFEKLIISITSCSLLALINLPVLYMVSFICNQSVKDLTTAQGNERIIILFLTKTLYFIVTQLIVYFKQEHTFFFKRNELILVVSNFTITFIISFLLYALSIDLWNKIYIYTIIVVFLTILNIIAFSFMKKINLKNAETIENELLRFSLEQNSEMIDKIKLQYDNLSAMRHDYVHELTYIQGVLYEKNYKKLEEYLNNKLGAEELKGYNYIFTSNKVIDSVINYKFEIAEQKGISVVCTFTTKIPENLEHDVSIILSNLLDNAIEASESLKSIKPQIILIVSEVAGYYNIMLKNRISNSVITENNQLKTTKSDKQHHGYGIRNIKMLVEMHNGMIDIYEKEGFFIVNTMLNI